MINVSEKAASALHDTLAENSNDGDELLRLTATPEGFGLVLGREQEGDQVVRHQDRAVLAVEREVADELDGATIDTMETPEGERLVFRGPGEESPAD